jgi:hypothetical protein
MLPAGLEVPVQPPAQSQAHLAVAAIRVLQHQEQRPPTVEEIASLLRFSKEYTGHLVRALDAAGIVQIIKSAFDQRVEVRDHHKIEALPAEEAGPGFKDEVDAFHQQFEAKQKKLQNLFDADERGDRQRQRFQNLDEDLRKFKSPRYDPFGEDPEKPR